jgi:hypothetical protein
LELAHHRFDKQLGEPGAPMISSDRRDHEVPIRSVRLTSFVSEEFVCGYRNDRAIDFEHKDFPLKFRVRRTIPPREQSRQNLGDFGEPLVVARAEIEVLQVVLIAVAGVPENHLSIGATGRTGPDGRQAGASAFARGGVRRLPFAKLRRGRFEGVLSTVMMRWIVDQRASRRPFSMRDKSACVTPHSSANACWLKPSA